MRHLAHSCTHYPGDTFKGSSFTPHACNQCPAAIQNFLEDMLDMLDDPGVKVPSQGLPSIIWHNSATYFPGETLVNAMHAGASFFRARPDIIFVCLPEKGGAVPHVFESRTSFVLSLRPLEVHSTPHDRYNIPRLQGSGQAVQSE